MNRSDEFFVSGLLNYLDAVSAVDIFQKEAKRRVKSLTEKRLAELSDSLGVPLPLRDYYYSELPDRVQIGQQVLFKSFGTLYFYFNFDRDSNGKPMVEPTISFNRDRKDLLAALWVDAMQRREDTRDENLGVNAGAIWLTSGTPCIGGSSCEDVFDGVIDGWIGLWKALGGMSRYLR